MGSRIDESPVGRHSRRVLQVGEWDALAVHDERGWAVAGGEGRPVRTGGPAAPALTGEGHAVEPGPSAGGPRRPHAAALARGPGCSPPAHRPNAQAGRGGVDR